MRHVARSLLLLSAAARIAHAQPDPADPAAPTTTTTPVAGDAAASAAADDAEAPKKKKHKRGARADFHVGAWRGTVDGSAELRGGALSGRSTLRTRGGLIDGQAGAEPALEQGRWRLALPVTIGHRETPGADLRETRGGIDADARWKRDARLRLDLELGLRLTSRPGWADEYQPTATGLGATDRYSHRDLRLGAALTAIPLRHQHARLGLRVTDYDYDDDPAYDAIDAAPHLVPGDRREIDLDGSWRHFGDGWKLGGAIAFEDRRDDRNYARDAGTGVTHAGAGGPPPNPLYHQLSFEPSIGAELELRDETIELGADLGYAIVSDRYQGYYSWRGLHPQLHARVHVGALDAKLTGEAQLATYGDGSYAAGGNHPPLESGTVRKDTKLEGRLDVGYQVRRHLTVVAGADVTKRTTNFPDYVPGVFPAGAQYDVRWDYVNWEASAGVRFER